MLTWQGEISLCVYACVCVCWWGSREGAVLRGEEQGRHHHGQLINRLLKNDICVCKKKNRNIRQRKTWLIFNAITLSHLPSRLCICANMIVLSIFCKNLFPSIRQKHGSSGPTFCLCCPLISCFGVSHVFPYHWQLPDKCHMHCASGHSQDIVPSPWSPKGSGCGTGQLSSLRLYLFRLINHGKGLNG